jgi:hypothetical protein
MKRRGERNIPDYSQKAKPNRATPDANRSAQPPTKPARAPQVKPQATSSKSGGRRGS